MGRDHVSYSELATWKGCSWRHKLKYLDDTPDVKNDASIHTEFGKAVHGALASYLEARVMPDSSVIVENLDKNLTKLGIEVEEQDKPLFHGTVKPILESVSLFLDSKFSGWEFVASEQLLFETIEGNDTVSFKGFIDGIIKVPKSSRLKTAKPDEFEYWIIDWKVCGWGWTLDQKTDPVKTLQLVLYKHFWSKRLGVPLNNIRCGFVLLKRVPGKKARCELVPVSVGEKSISKALETLGTMLGSVKKNLFSKNRNSCRFCEFYNTKYCT